MMLITKRLKIFADFSWPGVVRVWHQVRASLLARYVSENDFRWTIKVKFCFGRMARMFCKGDCLRLRHAFPPAKAA